MIRLLRSEFRKVATTKLWWGMLLGAIAFAALGVVAQIATNGLRDNRLGPLTSAATQRSILASASSGYLFALIVGIIMITTEFRHFTSRPTFLLEPHRGRVIVAKMLVGAGLGVLYGVACVAVAVAITTPWLAIKGVTIAWVDSGLIGVMLGILFVIAIFAIVGIGIGVLFRNQVAAQITALAYLFVIEPLVAIIPGIKEVYPYLPGAAANALTGTLRNQALLLAPWQGGLLLLGWGLLIAALGLVLTVSRDIP